MSTLPSAWLPLSHAAARASVLAADAGESATEVRPCGWFDSSHDLRTGLLVREHAAADAIAGELPLRDWLELHLAQHRFTQPT